MRDDVLQSLISETITDGNLKNIAGKIFEKQERLEEAADMYKLVIPQYRKSNCSALASKNLKDLNL